MKKRSSTEPRKSKWCANCQYDLSEYSNKFILETFNLCRKCTKELKPKENKMDCPVCGCQDTKFVSGIGKATRRPWSAYDCTNPVCKNEKGFQTRTFVNAQAGQAKFPPKAQAIFNPKQVGNLGPTIADIMKELKKMQDFMGMVPPIDEVNKELDIEANQSPF